MGRIPKWTKIVARPVVVIAGLCGAAANAVAADSIWNHNGSEMLWVANGDARTISYHVPRSGLSVAPGTILFEGRRVGNSLEGTARIFRQGCPPAEYMVSGPIVSETHIVLYGPAPVRAATGCAVTGYSQSSSNAVLEFSYLRSASGPDTIVQGETDGWVTIQPADEEHGQDAVGHRTFAIALPDASEILVRVDTGVASHVMPDMVNAALTCSSGARYMLLPAGGLNVCSVDDVSADLIGRTLMIDASLYDNETGACDPLRFEYSFAGLCR